MNWFVYIVKCSDTTLYTGITTNIARRIQEHNAHHSLGARYVRSRRPVQLVFSQAVHSRSEALKKEDKIKKLSRSSKKRLIMSAGIVR